ncbi:MAG: putative bifunctional diguanylate cyclase/phosphodiesterase [Geminicoccaceae bacterium]
MSLRARIAVTISLLELVLIAAVLYITLTHSMEGVEEQIESSQQVTMDLLGDLSKAALITEEFDELQTFINGTERDPNIRTVMIGDVEGRVIAATDGAMLGESMPAFQDKGDRYWRSIDVRGAYADLGRLAIEFSQAPLRQAYQRTLNIGLMIAVVGTVVIALAGWLMGHVLTRRLWSLAVAADKVACGESDIRVFLPGCDEVARVGRAFNSMVDRLGENLSALQASRDRLIKPTEAISEGFALWSADGQLVLCNRQFREIFETIEPAIEIGMTHGRLNALIEEHLVVRRAERPGHEGGGSTEDDSEDQPELLRAREIELNTGRWISLCEFRTPDGELIGIYTDISAKKATEETIRYQATHDALTGLPNRALFDQRLDEALTEARGEGDRLAVAFLDLDRFKLVNDGLGHRVGDDLLVAVAERLQSSIGEGDLVARMGGDEFILIFPELSHVDDVRPKVRPILEAMRPSFQIGGQELHVTASVGVSLYPEDGRSADQLLKAADIALYRAKSAGRDRWQLVNASMDDAAFERIVLEAQLRRAIDQAQFSLDYQPQVNLRSGQVVGVEALVRWRHPEWGLVPPEQFIPLAEETGLIYDLGLWILETACRQHARWREAGLDDLRLAVNISPFQLKRTHLERDVRAILERTGMVLDQLEFELTETTLMQEGETTRLLQRLAALGISMALDDFGTGYSSLSYLRRFPIDRIKIDRSFVCDISGSQSDGALARAVIMLAHGLNIGVIAEGVETAAQLGLLRHFGCDEAQGFLLGEPVAGDDLPQLIAERNQPPTVKVALAAV